MATVMSGTPSKTARRRPWSIIGLAGVPVASPLLLVVDTFQGLEDLARAARQRTSARIAAVTGSVGKTGTKDMLHQGADAPGGLAHASDRSYNNQVGTPLSLARMPQAADYGVFEIGTNAPGEIRPLARLVRPHVALVTTIEPVHIGNFASEDALVEEKAAVFDGLEEDGRRDHQCRQPPCGDPRRPCGAPRRVKTVRFGASGQTDFRLVNWTPVATGSRVRVAVADTEFDYDLSLHGRHLALNSVAVLAAVDALGGDIREAAASLAAILPLSGRGARQTIALPRRARHRH